MKHKRPEIGETVFVVIKGMTIQSPAIVTFVYSDTIIDVSLIERGAFQLMPLPHLERDDKGALPNTWCEVELPASKLA